MFINAIEKCLDFMSKPFEDCKRRHIFLDYFSHNSEFERARELLKRSTDWARLSSFDCRIENFLNSKLEDLPNQKHYF